MKKPKFIRKPRSFKPSVKEMVKELYDQIVPAIQTPAQAEVVEADLYRSMLGGLISDAEYLNYRLQIVEKYLSNNWVIPIE